MGVYKLKFTPEAVEDITEAAAYYEDQKQGLGKRFRSFVKGKLVLIKESPLIYELRYGDVRFAPVDFFPYSVHFTVDKSERIIQIHAVLCQYRNPVKFWKGFED
ncbi:MAG: type II toxin-antitoxin system RelE/ParE family toxin [Dyadobacter sp.]|uniref:type II toxin-antitoxin system RelE/ParE family toxin n=1 Tax=Dyadobacter sp. TaxID=1914288 RepID=UPI001B019378|nr:type II toxin-antitoxin system RelE/ParE family toxin [Dyadobacter sp.]